MMVREADVGPRPAPAMDGPAGSYSICRPRRCALLLDRGPDPDGRCTGREEFFWSLAGWIALNCATMRQLGFNASKRRWVDSQNKKATITSQKLDCKDPKGS